MSRIRISSGAKWEELVGYSRAVRVGNTIEVAGTTAMVAGELQGINNPYQQTKVIFQIIEQALIEAGASLQDVVRTRMFVTNIEAHWEDIGRAHGEFFSAIKPSSTMVEVSKLIDPRMLIEIEVTAIVA
ncbi:MAG: RidA family protein [Flammeovirgaceae bacterium]